MVEERPEIVVVSSVSSFAGSSEGSLGTPDLPPPPPHVDGRRIQESVIPMARRPMIGRKKEKSPSAAERRRREEAAELNRREQHRQYLQHLKDPIDIGRARRKEEARRAEWEAVHGSL